MYNSKDNWHARGNFDRKKKNEIEREREGEGGSISKKEEMNKESGRKRKAPHSQKYLY